MKQYILLEFYFVAYLCDWTPIALPSDELKTKQLSLSDEVNE